MSKFKNRNKFQPSPKVETPNKGNFKDLGYTTDEYPLNLRKDFDSESEILDVLEPHTKILIFDYIDEWAEIEVPQKELKGFVKKDYITIVE